MTRYLRNITFDSHDPAALARFWAEAMGWNVEFANERMAAVKRADGQNPRLFFNAVPETKTVKNRVHVCVNTFDFDGDAGRLIALGATRSADHAEHSVLLDPEGNEFCLQRIGPPAVEEYGPQHREWAVGLLRDHGMERAVSRGVMYHPADLPGFVAHAHGGPSTLLTYDIDGDQCQVVALYSGWEEKGGASAVLDAARRRVVESGCRRLWLITTNNNTHAIRFYQRRGMRLAAVHIDALADSRRLKPEIPLTDSEGIPIAHELEFEWEVP